MNVATRLKVALKKNKSTRWLFNIGKKIYRDAKYNNTFNYTGSFANRQRGSNKLCIMLAGYKEFLYPSTIKRLEDFQDVEMDVCIVTSGKYSETISDLCKKNNWSYLSTRENNVSLVQNVAIKLHPNAEYIFKLDEDIFITDNFFSKMEEAYIHAKQGPYNPGVIAPLIPVNGYGNYRVLEIKGLLADYERLIEKPLYEAGPHRQIENNPLAAEYMWRNVDIDELNKVLKNQPLKEVPCAIRFSIGAILFKRELWEEMGYFSVDRHSNAMGRDEAEINTFCNQNSRPFMISENVVVGHFAFGAQTEHMRKIYESEPGLFGLPVG